jgi:hypothetical protein
MSFVGRLSGKKSVIDLLMGDGRVPRAASVRSFVVDGSGLDPDGPVGFGVFAFVPFGLVAARECARFR